MKRQNSSNTYKNIIYMKPINIDIMVNGGRTFYHRLTYPVQHMLDKPPVCRIMDYVDSKLPTLMMKDDVLVFIKYPNDDKKFDYTKYRKQKHIK